MTEFDFIVSGTSDERFTAGAGAGLVEETAIREVVDGPALELEGGLEFDWTVLGQLSSDNGPAFSSIFGRLDLDIGETGRIEAASGTAVDGRLLAGAGTVTNAGEISASQTAVRLTPQRDGSFQVENSGSLAAGEVGVSMSTRSGNLVVMNSGTLNGGAVGVEAKIFFSGGAQVTNTGTIIGTTTAISLSSSIGSIGVDNAGTIVGDIAMGGGNATSNQVTNTGHIDGNITGVAVYSGEDGTITGTIAAGRGARGVEIRTGSQDNVIVGGVYDDILDGGAGDDLIEGGDGDDTIIGGDGIDTAGFTGLATDYSFTMNNDGSVTVVHEGNGTDTLESIEFASFTGETGRTSIDELVNGDDDGENVVHDDPTVTQHLTGNTDADVFKIIGNSADTNFGATEDGTGVVVWNENGFDILRGFETLRFNDSDVSLTGGETLFQNDPAVTQHLVSTGAADVFVVGGAVENFGFGDTEDQSGTVIWNGDAYDVLRDFETLRFDNVDVSLVDDVFTYRDDPQETQHLTGAGPRNVFAIEASSQGYGWGATEDGTGIVVWSGETYDILQGFDALHFNDGSFELA